MSTDTHKRVLSTWHLFIVAILLSNYFSSDARNQFLRCCHHYYVILPSLTVPLLFSSHPTLPQVLFNQLIKLEMDECTKLWGQTHHNYIKPLAKQPFQLTMYVSIDNKWVCALRVQGGHRNDGAIILFLFQPSFSILHLSLLSFYSH